MESLNMFRPWLVEAFSVIVAGFFLAMLLAHARNQMVYTHHQVLVDESRVCVYGLGTFTVSCLLSCLLSLGVREYSRWKGIAEEAKAASRKEKAGVQGLLSAEKRRRDQADKPFVQAVFVGGQANRKGRKSYLLVTVGGLFLCTVLAAVGVLGVGKISDKFWVSGNASNPADNLTSTSVIQHLQVHAYFR